MNPVTNLRDLARRAGVSLATASLALRGSPKVSAKTRELVRKAAEASGYNPETTVAAIMRRVRTRSGANRFLGTLACIYEPPAESPKRPVLPPQMKEGVDARAARLGYKIDYLPVGRTKHEQQRLREVLRNRGIRGVVIAPFWTQTSMADFDFSGFAVAEIGLWLHEPILHRTDCFHLGAIQAALNELGARGYRRVALATSVTHNARVAHAWTAGFREWHAERERSALPVFFYPEKSDASFPGFRKWVEEVKPDVVVQTFSGDLTYRLLGQCGLRVPEDIGFASLYCEAKHPWSGINQRPGLTAEAAVDFVVTQLQTGESGVPRAPRLMLTQGVWHEGKTLRQTLVKA